MVVRMRGLFGQNKQEFADECPNAILYDFSYKTLIYPSK
jgi:hypothetical protein